MDIENSFDYNSELEFVKELPGPFNFQSQVQRLITIDDEKDISKFTSIPSLNQIFYFDNEIIYISIETDVIKINRNKIYEDPIQDTSFKFKFNYPITPNIIVIPVSFRFQEPIKAFLLVPLANGFVIQLSLLKDGSFKMKGIHTPFYKVFRLGKIVNESGLFMNSFALHGKYEVTLDNNQSIIEVSAVTTEASIYVYWLNLINIEIDEYVHYNKEITYLLSNYVLDIMKSVIQKTRPDIYVQDKECIISHIYFRHSLLFLLTKNFVLKVFNLEEKKCIKEFHLKTLNHSSTQVPKVRLLFSPKSAFFRNTKHKMYFQLTLLVNGEINFLNILTFSIRFPYSTEGVSADDLQKVDLFMIPDKKISLSTKDDITLEHIVNIDEFDKKYIIKDFSQSADSILVAYENKLENKLVVYDLKDGLKPKKVWQIEDKLKKVIGDCRLLMKQNYIEKDRNSIELIVRHLYCSGLLQLLNINSSTTQLDLLHNIIDEYKSNSIKTIEKLKGIIHEIELGIKKYSQIDCVLLTGTAFLPIVVRVDDINTIYSISYLMNTSKFESISLICNSIQNSLYYSSSGDYLNGMFSNNDLNNILEKLWKNILVNDRVSQIADDDEDDLIFIDPYEYYKYLAYLPNCNSDAHQLLSNLVKAYFKENISVNQEEWTIINSTFFEVIKVMEIILDESFSHDNSLEDEPFLESPKKYLLSSIITENVLSYLNSLNSLFIKLYILTNIIQCNNPEFTIDEFDKKRIYELVNQLSTFVSLDFVLNQEVSSTIINPKAQALTIKNKNPILLQLLNKYSDSIYSDLVLVRDWDKWITEWSLKVIDMLIFPANICANPTNFIFFSNFLIKNKEYEQLLAWTAFLKQKDPVIEYRRAECFSQMKFQNEYLRSIFYVASYCNAYYKEKFFVEREHKGLWTINKLFVGSKALLSKEADLNHFFQMLTRNENSLFGLTVAAIMCIEEKKEDFYKKILIEFLNNNEFHLAYNVLLFSEKTERNSLVHFFLRYTLELNQTQLFGTLPASNFLFSNIISAISQEVSNTIKEMPISVNQSPQIDTIIQKLQTLFSIIYDIHISHENYYEAGFSYIAFCSQIELYISCFKKNKRRVIQMLNILIECLNIALTCLELSDMSDQGYIIDDDLMPEELFSNKRDFLSMNNSDTSILTAKKDDVEQFYKSKNNDDKCITKKDLNTRIIACEIILFFMDRLEIIPDFKHEDIRLSNFGKDPEDIVKKLICLGNENLAIHFCRYYPKGFKTLLCIFVYKYLEVKAELKEKNDQNSLKNEQDFYRYQKNHYMKLIHTCFMNHDTENHKVKRKIAKLFLFMGNGHLPKVIKKTLLEKIPVKTLLYMMRYYCIDEETERAISISNFFKMFLENRTKQNNINLALSKNIQMNYIDPQFIAKIMINLKPVQNDRVQNDYEEIIRYLNSPSLLDNLPE